MKNKFAINKGLKAHIFSTILFFIIFILAVFKNNNQNIGDVRIFFGILFLIIHIGIAMMSYLEDWYDKE